MNSTLSLFHHLYENIPPLFPSESKEKIKKIITDLESNSSTTLERVEEEMIKAGYEIWPWRQAYNEIFFKIQISIGDHFLLPNLSEEIQKKYFDFKRNGGTLEDFHRGKHLHDFSSEEKHELCEAFIKMRQEIKKYLTQHIATTERKKYLSRVKEYTYLLKNMYHVLEKLRNMAEKEEDHPILVDEIKAQVRSFEESLCLLGGDLDYTAVCEAPEFFEQRKIHLDRMKGIHLPKQFDFYN